MSLTKEEAQVISGVTVDPGYILLMERLTAGIDTLADKLHAATREETEFLLPLWRALRTVVIELKYAPQDMVKFLDDIKADDQLTDISAVAQNQLDTFLNNYNKIHQINDPKPETMDDLLPQNTAKKWSNQSFGNLR